MISQLSQHYHLASSNHQLQSSLTIFCMPLPVPLESIPFKAVTVVVTHGNLKPHHVTLQLNTVPYDFIFFRVQNTVSAII